MRSELEPSREGIDHRENPRNRSRSSCGRDNRDETKASNDEFEKEEEQPRVVRNNNRRSDDPRV